MKTAPILYGYMEEQIGFADTGTADRRRGCDACRGLIALNASLRQRRGAKLATTKHVLVARDLAKLLTCLSWQAIE
jgi:hypothetical protein